MSIYENFKTIFVRLAGNARFVLNHKWCETPLRLCLGNFGVRNYFGIVIVSDCLASI